MRHVVKKWNLLKLIGVIPCADAGFCNADVENRVAHVAIQFISTLDSDGKILLKFLTI